MIKWRLRYYVSAVAVLSPMKMSAEVLGNPGAGVLEPRCSYSNNFYFLISFFLFPALNKYIPGLESTVWAKARLVLGLQLCVCARMSVHSFSLL